MLLLTKVCREFTCSVELVLFNLVLVGIPQVKAESNIENTTNSKARPNKGASIWSGFHQKTVKDRVNLLKKIYPTLEEQTLMNGGLALTSADLMVENCVGILPLPLGLGLNFLINGTKYVVPMAIEEPSVIAAASSAAKFICERGDGFKVHTTEPVMAAQIQIIGVDYDSIKYVIDENKKLIIEFANTH